MLKSRKVTRATKTKRYVFDLDIGESMLIGISHIFMSRVTNMP